jgi:alkaline phosphatase D
MRDALPNNQHFGYFFPVRSGYMRCTVTDEHWTTDMRAIDRTDRPGGKTSTSASFIFESGKIGTQRA